ncbi:MAG: AzlD domain-containing protein [Chloroflexota bacterium]
MNEFVLIAGMTAVTFSVRYPILAIFGRLNLPPALLRALRYVPPAVLTAIIAPAVVMPNGAVDLSLDNAHLVGAIAAVLVAWWTKNLLWTIVLGMAVFLLWRGFF